MVKKKLFILLSLIISCFSVIAATPNAWTLDNFWTLINTDLYYSDGDIHIGGDLWLNGSIFRVEGKIVNGSWIPDLNNTFTVANETNLWSEGWFNKLYAPELLKVGDNNLYASGGNVGIGTTSPTSEFELVGEGGDIQIRNTAYTTSATQRATLELRHARGTVASPTVLSTNDVIGSFAFGGYDGSNFQYGGLVEAFVDDTVSSGSVPTRISFTTGSNSGDRAERLTIKNNGNVGIGTTSPTHKLSVDGGSVNFSNSNGTNFFVDNDTGYVGIGTTSPSHLLHINQVSTTNSAGYFYRDLTDASTDSPVIQIINDNTGDREDVLSIQDDSGGTSIIIDKNNFGTGLDMTVGPISTTSPMTGISVYTRNDGTGTVRGMEIDVYGSTAYGLLVTGGNVGIGTTSPGTKLDVNSSTENQVAHFSSSDQAAKILFSDDDTTGYWGVQDDIMGVGFSATFGDNILFLTDGNVGIGTTSPNSLLQINGTTNSLLNITNGTDDFVTVLNTGNVGIGTTSLGTTVKGVSQSAKLHILANTPNTDTMNMERQVDSGQPNFAFSRSRASITAVQDDDFLGKFSFRGYDGTDYNTGATIQAIVNGAVSANTIPTDLAFLTTTTNSPTERMRIASNGNVGIGTTSPGITRTGTDFNVKFHLVADDVAGYTVVNEIDSTTALRGPTYLGARSRSSGLVNDNDTLLSYIALGHDGTDYVDAGYIRMKVDGTPGANDMPGRIEFATTPNNQVTPVVRMTIKANGNVGIGTTSPSTDLTVAGNLSVSGNVTAENLFIPQYVFSHTNYTIALDTASVWQNVSFEQEEPDIKFGIDHTFSDNTNHTFTIMQDGVYNIDFDFDIQDTSASASNIDIAGRAIHTNGTEITGSVFEADITKQGVEIELSHNFLAELKAGDEIVFQFVADDVDVQISTHATFGDHPESATILMHKIGNLL